MDFIANTKLIYKFAEFNIYRKTLRACDTGLLLTRYESLIASDLS